MTEEALDSRFRGNDKEECGDDKIEGRDCFASLAMTKGEIAASLRSSQ
jgi:hypothetical protein